MKPLNSSHPDGEQLLRYADGELAAAEMPAIRTHLEACWQCRTELEEIHQTINECVRYRKSVLETHLPSPPAPWGDIRTKFAQADASLGRPSLMDQWRTAFSALFTGPRRYATASILLGAVVVAGTVKIYLDQPVPQTAPTVINQTPAALGPTNSEQVHTVAPALSAPAVSMPPTDGTLPATLPAATPADELRVFVALHLVGADLGEPVQVSRSEGRIHVTGLGIDPSRQARILAALSAIPHLDIRFTEPAPATARVEDFTPAANAGATAAGTGLQEQILRQLGSRNAFEQFSNQTMEHSETLMARAYAVRRLAQRFTVEVEAGLSTDDRRMLTDLRRQHMTVLEQESNQLLRATQSVVPSMALPVAQASAAGSWQAASEQMFQLSQQLERSLAVALGAAKGDISSERLFTNIAQLKGSIEANRRILSQE